MSLDVGWLTLLIFVWGQCEGLNSRISTKNSPHVFFVSLHQLFTQGRGRGVFGIVLFTKMSKRVCLPGQTGTGFNPRKQTTRLLLLLALLLACPCQKVLSDNVSQDRDQYRRSSLCLILINHTDKKYAAQMQRVFSDFPLPARYNEHNISSLRVINVNRKQSRKDIDQLLKDHRIAQQVVGRWFNRDAVTGQMNMDLIHERGGYGASYADYETSLSNVRGTAMLRDEGIELLQSTFVLVCDMNYIDKSKGSRWGALGLSLLSLGSAVMSGVEQQKANEEARKGNYEKAYQKQKSASTWMAGSALGAAGAAVVADIGGFRVKMQAYLYKLHWDDAMTQSMYGDYWCDSLTPESEQGSRVARFSNAAGKFTLDFIGQYKATSSKTILRSWSNEDEVILDVCERCVNKGMKELARSFATFRPRAPFYFDGGRVYSHIGRKEDVTIGKKYEILQPYKNKKGEICYKRVGKAEAGSPWNNRDIRFDEYFNTEEKGTLFYCQKSSVDLHTPGLQLREL